MNKTSTIADGKFGAQLVELMPRLRRFCLSLTANPEAADDLLQATFERALARQQLFQSGTRLDHWLLRLARNLHIDQIRALKSRGGAGEALELAAHVVGSDGLRVVESRSELALAGEAFLALPQANREVFALVVLEGLSYRDAAELLELPVGTVMSRIARTRAALERALQHQPVGIEHDHR